jgi:hypothetical protein
MSGNLLPIIAATHPPIKTHLNQFPLEMPVTRELPFEIPLRLCQHLQSQVAARSWQ